MAVPFSNTKLRVPRGFQNLLEGLAKEVLRSQPENIHNFAAIYFDNLVKIREEKGTDIAEIGAKHEDRFYNNKAFSKAGNMGDVSDPQQQQAATTIQAAVRGHQVRRELKVTEAGRTRDEEAAARVQPAGGPSQDRTDDALSAQQEAAATRIQAAYRGYGTRKNIGPNRHTAVDAKKAREATAATTIQAAYRGYETRKNIGPSQDTRKVAAAITIQAAYRGYEIRKNIVSSQDMAVGALTAQQEAAATTIQAAYRGYEMRKHMAEGDSAVGSRTDAAGQEPGIDIDLTDPETQRAAAKIQASFRGHQTRKALKDKDGTSIVTEPPGEAVTKGTKEEGAAEVSLGVEETREQPPAEEEEVVDIDLTDPEVEKAAVKIQGGFKMLKAKREVEELKKAKEGTATDVAEERRPEIEEVTEEVTAPSAEEDIDIDLEDPEVGKAAEKIQATFRGFQTRKKLKEESEPSPDAGAADETIKAPELETGLTQPEEVPADGELLGHIDPSDPKVNIAASKIQAGYKGMKVRKELASLHGVPESLPVTVANAPLLSSRSSKVSSSQPESGIESASQKPPPVVRSSTVMAVLKAVYDKVEKLVAGERKADMTEECFVADVEQVQEEEATVEGDRDVRITPEDTTVVDDESMEQETPAIGGLESDVSFVKGIVYDIAWEVAFKDAGTSEAPVSLVSDDSVVEDMISGLVEKVAEMGADSGQVCPDIEEKEELIEHEPERVGSPVPQDTGNNEDTKLGYELARLGASIVGEMVFGLVEKVAEMDTERGEVCSGTQEREEIVKDRPEPQDTGNIEDSKLDDGQAELVEVPVATTYEGGVETAPETEVTFGDQESKLIGLSSSHPKSDASFVKGVISDLADEAVMIVSDETVDTEPVGVSTGAVPSQTETPSQTELEDISQLVGELVGRVDGAQPSSPDDGEVIKEAVLLEAVEPPLEVGEELYQPEAEGESLQEMQEEPSGVADSEGVDQQLSKEPAGAEVRDRTVQSQAGLLSQAVPEDVSQVVDELVGSVHEDQPSFPDDDQMIKEAVFVEAGKPQEASESAQEMPGDQLVAIISEKVDQQPSKGDGIGGRTVPIQTGIASRAVPGAVTQLVGELVGSIDGVPSSFPEEGAMANEPVSMEALESPQGMEQEVYQLVEEAIVNRTFVGVEDAQQAVSGDEYVRVIEVLQEVISQAEGDAVVETLREMTEEVSQTVQEVVSKTVVGFKGGQKVILDGEAIKDDQAKASEMLEVEKRELGAVEDSQTEIIEEVPQTVKEVFSSEEVVEVEEPVTDEFEGKAIEEGTEYPPENMGKDLQRIEATISNRAVGEVNGESEALAPSELAGDLILNKNKPAQMLASAQELTDEVSRSIEETVSSEAMAGVEEDSQEPEEAATPQFAERKSLAVERLGSILPDVAESGVTGELISTEFPLLVGAKIDDLEAVYDQLTQGTVKEESAVIPDVLQEVVAVESQMEEEVIHNLSEGVDDGVKQQASPEEPASDAFRDEVDVIPTRDTMYLTEQVEEKYEAQAMPHDSEVPRDVTVTGISETMKSDAQVAEELESEEQEQAKETAEIESEITEALQDVIGEVSQTVEESVSSLPEGVVDSKEQQVLSEEPAVRVMKDETDLVKTLDSTDIPEPVVGSREAHVMPDDETLEDIPVTDKPQMTESVTTESDAAMPHGVDNEKERPTPDQQGTVTNESGEISDALQVIVGEVSQNMEGTISHLPGGDVDSTVQQELFEEPAYLAPESVPVSDAVMERDESSVPTVQETTARETIDHGAAKDEPDLGSATETTQASDVLLSTGEADSAVMRKKSSRESGVSLPRGKEEMTGLENEEAVEVSDLRTGGEESTGASKVSSAQIVRELVGHLGEETLADEEHSDEATAGDGDTTKMAHDVDKSVPTFLEEESDKEGQREGTVEVTATPREDKDSSLAVTVETKDKIVEQTLIAQEDSTNVDLESEIQRADAEKSSQDKMEDAAAEKETEPESGIRDVAAGQKEVAGDDRSEVETTDQKIDDQELVDDIAGGEPEATTVNQRPDTDEFRTDLKTVSGAQEIGTTLEETTGDQDGEDEGIGSSARVDQQPKKEEQAPQIVAEGMSDEPIENKNVGSSGAEDEVQTDPKATGDVQKVGEAAIHDDSTRVKVEATGLAEEETIDIDLKDPEVEKAALKIQSSFKGRFKKKKSSLSTPRKLTEQEAPQETRDQTEDNPAAVREDPREAGEPPSGVEDAEVDGEAPSGVEDTKVDGEQKITSEAIDEKCSSSGKNIHKESLGYSSQGHKVKSQKAQVVSKIPHKPDTGAQHGSSKASDGGHQSTKPVKHIPHPPKGSVPGNQKTKARGVKTVPGTVLSSHPGKSTGNTALVNDHTSKHAEVAKRSAGRDSTDVKEPARSLSNGQVRKDQEVRGHKEEENVDIDLDDPEVEKAALKIQNGFRGKFKKKSHGRDLGSSAIGSKPNMASRNERDEKVADIGEEEIDIDLDDPEVEKAALKIQNSFKGKFKKSGKGKSGVENTDTKHKHPVQSNIKEATEDEIDIDLKDPEVEKAALKIQSSFKGRFKKKGSSIPVARDPTKLKTEVQKESQEVAKTQEEEIVDIDLEDPEVEKAALKIQSSFKGKFRKKGADKTPSLESGIISEQEKHPSTGRDKKGVKEEIDIDLGDPEVEKAALKIQSSFKGKFKKNQKTGISPVPACTPEQSLEKRSDVIEDAKEQEEEIDIDLKDPEVEKAALKIQSSFKGKFRRKGPGSGVGNVKEKEIDPDGIQKELQKEQTRAANGPTSQEGVMAGKDRGHKEDEEVVDIDLDDPEVQKAAVQIQAGFKGLMRRRRKKSKSGEVTGSEAAAMEGPKGKVGGITGGDATEEQTDNPSAAGKVEEVDIDLADPEVEQAALKIQAGFKGFKARKELKSKGSEAADASPAGGGEETPKTDPAGDTPASKEDTPPTESDSASAVQETAVVDKDSPLKGDDQESSGGAPTTEGGISSKAPEAPPTEGEVLPTEGEIPLTEEEAPPTEKDAPPAES